MKQIRLLFFIMLVGQFFANCVNGPEEYVDLRGSDYAGPQSCVQCHKTIHQSAVQTAHFKATSPATPSNVLGDFTSPHNAFVYNATTKLSMEKRGDSLYQVLYKNGKEVNNYRFDIVFGSQNAQTAVYRKDRNTYVLPVSYYKSVHKWATSPGFSATEPYFGRMAIKDCYACHSSNVNSKSIDGESQNTNFLSEEAEDVMNPNTIIYGIDCERCHGPAKKHVTHHLKFPDERTAQGIIRFADLNNQQKLDACAICHSGVDGVKIKSRFEFKPGDYINDYYLTNLSNANDVHGNQNGLLSQSRCFQKSETLNCVTCHSPHENASKNIEYYSKICISCHSAPKHRPKTLKSVPDNLIKSNCIDCHMPKQNSKAIQFQLPGDTKLSQYALRNHRIAVYPN